MSTNCIRCVGNRRTGNDLLCDRCRDNPPRRSPGIGASTMPEADTTNTTPIHPAVRAVLQFFVYSHLPPHLQTVSKPFMDLANTIACGPQNAEATVALRKLLEAKDAAVRAVLFKTP